jgi:hypothetical protein
VLLKALPLIGYVLTQVQPEDSSVGLIMTELSATFARGVAARSVVESVEGVLVPFFRAYEEAFARFQKSSSAEMPTMEDVWQEELTNPTVLAFLSLVGTSEAARGMSTDVSELEHLKARMAAMEKKSPRQTGGPPGPASGTAAVPGDTTRTRQPPTPADPNSKRSLAKAKAAAAAAAAGAPAAAAP